MTSFQFNFKTMNAYEIHKAVINTYVLTKPGDNVSLLKRDTSKDKRDIDVIRENHQFLWNEEEPTTWEQKLAKKYYDKLFKEYCICDLTLCKENKVALRWRTEQEIVVGRGQFSCGNKNCTLKDDLKTWEVNFGYYEKNVKKNALVKLRLCPPCSEKLNYRTKRREIKRLSKRRQNRDKGDKGDKSKQHKSDYEGTMSNEVTEIPNETNSTKEQTLWSQPQETTEKTREEEFEEYLEELLF